MAVPKRYRAPGYLPVLHYFVRDFLLFLRKGYSVRMSWASAADCWRFDRSL